MSTEAANVLVLQNATAEGPGTIGEFLRASRIPLTIVDLERGERIPDQGPFSHLVVLGGPMAVYEMGRVRYLADEIAFLEKAIGASKHVLGVCLGAQLIAHVLGGRVYPGGQKEVGWDEVELTREGMQDPCMRELAVNGRPVAQVFQWHGDTFDLPAGAVRLASSKVYPNQAFRFADRVHALQFHIEVTPQIVTGWLRNEKGVDLPLIDRRSQELSEPYLQRAQRFYRCAFRE